MSLRSIAVTILILLAAVAGGPARAQTAPPSNMTQEQFDALVDAITRSVLEKLKVEGTATATTTPPAKHGPFDAGSREAPDELDIFLRQAATVIRSVPTWGESVARLFDALDQSAQGGRARGTFLLLLAVAVGGALAAEAVLRRLLHPFSFRLAAGAIP